jgi:hypothetical protein
MQQHNVSAEDVRSGSDLSFLGPRQLLGLFAGLRGRHWWDVHQIDLAQRDFQAAMGLFPQNRLWRRMFAQCDLYRTVYHNNVIVSM